MLEQTTALRFNDANNYHKTLTKILSEIGKQNIVPDL